MFDFICFICLYVNQKYLVTSITDFVGHFGISLPDTDTCYNEADDGFFYRGNANTTSMVSM